MPEAAVRWYPQGVRLRSLLLLTLPAALTAAFCCPLAQALERVTLQNGFSYDCVGREVLPNGNVRLYLSADLAAAAEKSNFIDLSVERIAAVETLPDSLPAAVSTPEAALSAREDLHSLLTHAGTAHNIDRELLASIVNAESGGRHTAVSRTGARGLMQLMPGTAKEMGVADAFKPEDNINGGTAYLDLLLTRYRDNLALALAAYNAGPAAVDRFKGIPPFRETRLYVARVMNEFKRRKAALQATLVSH